MTARKLTKSQLEKLKTRPPIKTLLSTVPAFMRGLPRWVNWIYEWSHKMQKWTKVPVRFVALPDGRQTYVKIDYTDPSTHLPFAVAASYVSKHQAAGHLTVGLGFILSEGDQVVCFDLDDSRDADTGELTPYAREVIDEQRSYAEVSPSQRGVKIFSIGEKPGTRCKQKGSAVEMFSKVRFVAITGDVLHDSPPDLVANQPAITARYYATFPDDRPELVAAREAQRTARAAELARIEADPTILSRLSLSDAEIIDRAIHARNGERFLRLWRGDAADYGGDQSAADYALAGALAFWTGNNADRIISLMNQSGAWRKKWETKRGGVDYLTYTVNKLITTGGSSTCFGDLSEAPRSEFDHLSTSDRDSLVGQLVGGARERLAAARSRAQAALVAGIASLTTPNIDAIRSELEAAAATARESARIAREQERASRPRPCPRCKPILLANDGDPESGVPPRIRAVEPRCGCYSCEACAPLVKRIWITHLSGLILARSAPLYVAEIHDDKTTWDRVRKQIQRAGGERAFVSTGPGDGSSKVFVVSTVPFEGDPAELSPPDAAAALSAAILAIPCGPDVRRPITVSAGWKLPVTEPKGYYKVGGFPPDTRRVDIIQAFQGEGLAPDIGVSRNGMQWFADSEAPANCRNGGRADRRLAIAALHERLKMRVLGADPDLADAATTIRGRDGAPAEYEFNLSGLCPPGLSGATSPQP